MSKAILAPPTPAILITEEKFIPGGGELTADLCTQSSGPVFQSLCIFPGTGITLNCYIPGDSFIWSTQAKIPIFGDILMLQSSFNGTCRQGIATAEPDTVHLLDGVWVSCAAPADEINRANFTLIVLGECVRGPGPLNDIQHMLFS